MQFNRPRCPRALRCKYSTPVPPFAVISPHISSLAVSRHRKPGYLNRLIESPFQPTLHHIKLASIASKDQHWSFDQQSSRSRDSRAVRGSIFARRMNSRRIYIYIYRVVSEVCKISPCLRTERRENKMVFSFPPANVGEVKIVFTIDYTRYNKSNRRRCNKWSAWNYRDYLSKAISSVSAMASQLSSAAIFPQKDSQRCHIVSSSKSIKKLLPRHYFCESVFNIRASLATKIARTFWLSFFIGREVHCQRARWTSKYSRSRRDRKGFEKRQLRHVWPTLHRPGHSYQSVPFRVRSSGGIHHCLKSTRVLCNLRLRLFFFPRGNRSQIVRRSALYLPLYVR